MCKHCKGSWGEYESGDAAAEHDDVADVDVQNPPDYDPSADVGDDSPDPDLDCEHDNSSMPDPVPEQHANEPESWPEAGTLLEKPAAEHPDGTVPDATTEAEPGPEAVVGIAEPEGDDDNGTYDWDDDGWAWAEDGDAQDEHGWWADADGWQYETWSAAPFAHGWGRPNEPLRASGRRGYRGGRWRHWYSYRSGSSRGPY
jgi:hypothetical protein